MCRKIAVILTAFIFAVGAWFNVKPVFHAYSNEFQVCVNSPSSSGKIITVSKAEYPFSVGVKGESFQVKIKDFNLEKTLNDFSAKVLFTESIEDGVSYYAYSPKIRYKKQIKNKTVNMQIHFAKTTVTVGSPIIFGSF